LYYSSILLTSTGLIAALIRDAYRPEITGYQVSYSHVRSEPDAASTDMSPGRGFRVIIKVYLRDVGRQLIYLKFRAVE
jgi:hypothetical protein